jgi:hypothetical protein
MKKKLLLIVSLLVIAISVILPAAVFADEPASNNFPEGATTSSVDPAGPVYLYLSFYGLDDIFAYRVKAQYGSYIGVSVLDCCIPGDWWRANIVVYSGSTPALAATTHDIGDGNWSPEVVVPDVDSQNTMQALLTIAPGNHIPGGLPAGMTVKITSDAKQLIVVPVPSI